MAFVAPFVSVGQTTSNLSQEEIAEIEQRTKDLLTDFQGYLTEIGDKSNANNLRDVYIRRALKLFMGEGEPYKIDGKQHNAVIMQVSSLRNGVETKRNKLMKQYLRDLKNLPYTKVNITQAETVRVSNVYKVGDHYEATAIFFQYFEGYAKEKLRYKDNTKKTVKVYITYEDDYWGRHWNVKFGDIMVAETTN